MMEGISFVDVWPRGEMAAAQTTAHIVSELKRRVINFQAAKARAHAPAWKDFAAALTKDAAPKLERTMTPQRQRELIDAIHRAAYARELALWESGAEWKYGVQQQREPRH